MFFKNRKKIAEDRAKLVEKHKRDQQLAQARAFAAAKISNLLNDWTRTTKTIDAEIRAGGVALRARARDVSINNDYAKKYLQMVQDNVVGPAGIKLQSKAINRNGKLNEEANKIIEAGWLDFGKRGTCDVTGKLSIKEFEGLFIKGAAREGEVLTRKVKGFPNKYGFALQAFDVDLLDETYNATMPNGNVVKMSIEFDAWGAVVAYHLTQPNQTSETYFGGGRNRLIIPANEINHSFRTERAGQSRGFTWMSSALIHLNHLNAFEEAAIIASRVGASVMGFFTELYPDGGYEGDDKDEYGNLINEVEAGMFKKLPANVDVKEFKPGYPDGMYEEFVTRCLKSIASGLSVGYTSLASDPGETTFSSMRGEVLAERDHWRNIQSWMATDFLTDIFGDWLFQSIQVGALPFARDNATFERLNRPQWQPRGWAWVDPLRDVKAVQTAIDLNLKSRTRLLAEQGIDFSDEAKMIAIDNQIMADNGLIKEENSDGEEN
jgi:lambda family phage portal protein